MCDRNSGQREERPQREGIGGSAKKEHRPEKLEKREGRARVGKNHEGGEKLPLKMTFRRHRQRHRRELKKLSKHTKANGVGL